MTVHKEFFRYGLVSILSYAYLFSGVYLLVEWLNVLPNIAYFIVYSISYVIIYFLNSHFVFRTERTRDNAIRFILHSVFFWLFGNLFYNFLYYTFDLHYLWLVLINTALISVIRFSSLRHLVFRKDVRGGTSNIANKVLEI
ncbi:MAG TPA: GtrA family protein [Candidatus Paceibacterota bacterium]